MRTIVEKKWLKGVISMPSNISANTGTNVSVLFIDKFNVIGDIMLIDASKFGRKEAGRVHKETVGGIEI